MARKPQQSRPVINLLVAYPYMSKSMVRAINDLRSVAPVCLMLDSGAYTAWNSGKVITLDEYCAFIEEPPASCQHIVQLDVFGDPDRSYANLMEMRRRGFTEVLPVFTRGETLERLEEFYEMRPYIMFGGVTIGESNKKYVNWFLANNKKRACHWLGFVNLDYIRHHQPASVDSSSWHFTARTGSLALYMGHGKLKQFHRSAIATVKNLPQGVLHHNSVSGEELLTLKDAREWRSGKNAMSLNITARAHLLRSVDAERLFRTKIYLAASTSFQVDALRYAWEHMRH